MSKQKLEAQKKKENQSTLQISKTTYPPNSTQKKKCFFCGENFHPGGRNNCPAKTKTCLKCGKVGHFMRGCQSRPTKAASVQHLVQDKNEMQDETQAHCSSTLSKPYLMLVLAGAPQCLKPTAVPCVLKGLKIDGLLDTGASENFISEEVAKSVGGNILT